MIKNNDVLRRMIVIDPELFEKYKNLIIEEKQLSDTDRKLKNILLDNRLNDSDKWYLYRQVILRQPNNNMRLSDRTKVPSLHAIDKSSDLEARVHKKPKAEPSSYKFGKYFDTETQTNQKHVIDVQTSPLKARTQTNRKHEKEVQTSPLKASYPNSYNEEIYENEEEDEELPLNRLQKNANDYMVEQHLRKKLKNVVDPNAVLRRLRTSNDDDSIMVFEDESTGEHITAALSEDDDDEYTTPLKIPKTPSKSSKKAKLAAVTGALTDNNSPKRKRITRSTFNPSDMNYWELYKELNKKKKKTINR